MGLARAFADAKATHAGAVTGTVQYLAPEQIRGEPADPRSDLYSLGIVTYELLTGRLPFDGRDADGDRVQAPQRHRARRPRGSPTSAPDMDAFVAAAVDKDREMRPESATVMRSDLEAIARGLAPARAVARRPSSRTCPRSSAPRRTGRGRGGDVTATIPRTEEAPRRRRGRRFLGVLAIVLLDRRRRVGRVDLRDPAHARRPRRWSACPSTPPPTGSASSGSREARARAGTTAGPRRARCSAADPPAGTELEEGATVTLVPSLGPATDRAPRRHGRFVEAKARTALERAGFEVEIERAFHDEIVEGEVIRQSPAGDDGALRRRRHADRQRGTRPGRGPRRGRAPRGRGAEHAAP